VRRRRHRGPLPRPGRAGRTRHRGGPARRRRRRRGPRERGRPRHRRREGHARGRRLHDERVPGPDLRAHGGRRAGAARTAPDGRPTPNGCRPPSPSPSKRARQGVKTGNSEAERAVTLQLLAGGQAGPADFVRPGHVFPLRAKPGGVLTRPGHTEAAVDLARLAGLRPAGAIVEIAGEDGVMLRLPELVPFARKHGLTIISIEDLIAYRRSEEPTVKREAEVHLPTAAGEFTAYGYRSTVDGVEHVALVHGDIGDGEDVLVRVHSECLTGDIFHSLRCDCGPQLNASMESITRAGRGVVVYLRGHEGRGIGLLSKLRAYELQERGRDTLDANLELGLPADARDYAAGAQILADLGVRSVRLMTNNPDKSTALVRHGITVLGREPMPVQAGEHNLTYLRTKRDRMGHDLPWLDAVPATTCGNQ
ncbi:LOW QUALITY PROTEIN: 3,4-dihydroxy-2-butanone 4-phosphate synthase, partial [Streptomyces pristinaespiralis ATCC 25486]